MIARFGNPALICSKRPDGLESEAAMPQMTIGCPFASGLMNGLKAATQELHNNAENHEFQQRFSRGEITREDYVRYLGQMLHVHRALETGIRRLRSTVEALRLIPDYQFQQPYLEEDLAFFGVSLDEHPASPAVERLVARMKALELDEPLGLLGFHYVLEGSNNGSRIIARAIRHKLGLADGRGDRYLDPYGQEQRKLWMEFREKVNATTFSHEEAAAIASAARDMFQAVADISSDLLATIPVRSEPL